MIAVKDNAPRFTPEEYFACVTCDERDKTLKG
jgi:hypothetical protein